MKKELRMGWLNLNTKKSFAAISEFSFLRGGKGKNFEFQKIRIFEHNSALNYSMVKKFHVRRLDSSTKKFILTLFEFSILRVKIA